MKKTDTKGDDDVLMPVEIAASDLLHTVNAHLNDEVRKRSPGVTSHRRRKS